MPSYEERRAQVREKVAVAESAVQEYLYTRDYDHERFKRLLDNLHSARNELLALLEMLWPKSKINR